MINLVEKINPLNVLGCREVQDPPPYFTYTTVNIKLSVLKSIREWIFANLKHRFYIGDHLDLVDNQLVVNIRIGFEDSKESSFFFLACPHLK